MSISPENLTQGDQDFQAPKTRTIKAETIHLEKEKSEANSLAEVKKNYHKASKLEEIMQKTKEWLLKLIMAEPSAESQILDRIKSDPENAGKSKKDIITLAKKELNREYLLASHKEMQENVDEQITRQLELLELAQLKKTAKTEELNQYNLNRIQELDQKYRGEMQELKRLESRAGLNPQEILKLRNMEKELQDLDNGIITLKYSGLKQLDKDLQTWKRNLQSIKFTGEQDHRRAVLQQELIKQINTFQKDLNAIQVFYEMNNPSALKKLGKKCNGLFKRVMAIKEVKEEDEQLEIHNTSLSPEELARINTRGEKIRNELLEMAIEERKTQTIAA